MLFIFDSETRKRIMAHQNHEDVMFDFLSFLIQVNQLQQEGLILHRVNSILKGTATFKS